MNGKAIAAIQTAQVEGRREAAGRAEDDKGYTGPASGLVAVGLAGRHDEVIDAVAIDVAEAGHIAIAHGTTPAQLAIILQAFQLEAVGAIQRSQGDRGRERRAV